MLGDAIYMNRSSDFKYPDSWGFNVRQCLSWLDGLALRLVTGVAPATPAASPVVQDGENPDMRHTMFAYATATLAVRLMRADGEINTREHRAYLALFGVEGVGKRMMRALLTAATKDTAPSAQYARQLAALHAEDTSARHMLLYRFARVALADGPLGVEEFDFLCEVGHAFGMPRAQVARIADEAEGSAAGDPYRVLRVEKGATPEELQRAYHRRMRYCHPDRWGKKEEYQEMYRLAHLKAVAINDAYQALLKAGRLH